MDGAACDSEVFQGVCSMKGSEKGVTFKRGHFHKLIFWRGDMASRRDKVNNRLGLYSRVFGLLSRGC